jgi:hypothetical protein
MKDWLRGFVLFVILVTVPFTIELLLGHQPTLPKFISSIDWRDALTYSLIVLVIAAIIVYIYIKFKTAEISQYLTLAERDMNNLLRAWGGGPPTAATRQDIAKERGRWADILPADSMKREDLFELLKGDFEGGSSAKAMANARTHRFLAS